MSDGFRFGGQQRNTGELPVLDYWFNQETKLIRTAASDPDPIYWPPDKTARSYDLPDIR